MAQTLEAALRKRVVPVVWEEMSYGLLFCFNPDVSEEKIQEWVRDDLYKINLTPKAVEGGSGLSMGVACRTELTFNQLYELADKALYQAKESGRGRCVFIKRGDRWIKKMKNKIHFCGSGDVITSYHIV